jgi:hypothetical protein
MGIGPGGRAVGFTRRERARRFWTAHGRSRAQLTVLYAFASNPTLTWTAEGLATWFGLGADDIRRAVGEFADAGIVLRDALPWRGFRWNDHHDWAQPTTEPIRRVVVDRWLATTHPYAAER